MPNQASERLSRLNDQIMKTWEERAVSEVAAAVHQNSLALRDSLPEFLEQLVAALSTTIDRTKIRIKWDRDENTRLGKKHGRERAGSRSYTMDQLIFEYHILRQVICDVMEEEAPLSRVELEVITCAVEQAVNDAATEFSDTLHDIQEKFTHMLAHDLRGPIMATKLSSQLLLKRPNDVEQAMRIATRIASSMDRLDLMIHDLLDASSLRAGEKLKLEFENCDLDILLGQVADEINFLHGNRIHLKSVGPVVGCWNENSLRRVVDNLVTNALKFSLPASPITIELTKSDQGAEISVHNLGKPISPEEKSILFQQFRRARTAEGKMGWGLGLTVVKGIAEAHKGHVEVESSEEAGTVFKVGLPWSAAEPVKSGSTPKKLASAPHTSDQVESVKRHH